MKAYLVGLDKTDQESVVLDILQAFGGRQAPNATDATHVIVPDEVKKSELEEFRDPIMACWSASRRVGTVKWLRMVVECERDPWCRNLMIDMCPQTVRELAVEATEVVHRSPKKIRSGPPDNSRLSTGPLHPLSASHPAGPQRLQRSAAAQCLLKMQQHLFQEEHREGRAASPKRRRRQSAAKPKAPPEPVLATQNGGSSSSRSAAAAGKRATTTRAPAPAALPQEPTEPLPATQNGRRSSSRSAAALGKTAATTGAPAPAALPQEPLEPMLATQKGGSSSSRSAAAVGKRAATTMAPAPAALPQVSAEDVVMAPNDSAASTAASVNSTQQSQQSQQQSPKQPPAQPQRETIVSLLKRHRMSSKSSPSLQLPPAFADSFDASQDDPSTAAPQRQLAGSVQVDADPCHASRTPRSTAAPQRQLAGSLQETAEFLRRECPEEIEAGHLKLAIQNSLRDLAARRQTDELAVPVVHDLPEEVLGVPIGADAAEIKAAYRDKVRAAHPDKGGDSKEFMRIQKAYMVLAGLTEPADPAAAPLALTVGDSCGHFELRDHRALVKAKFEQDGVDLQACVARQQSAVDALSLEAEEVGAVSRNELGQVMYNQCFYLSLARSYFGCGACKQSVRDLALMFKRAVEAAVLVAHPDWGGNRVGEDVQAFSDFLVFVMGTNPLLSELTVAVFDSTCGGVELYVGRTFPGPDREDEQRSNLLTVKYLPGHYQALVPKPGVGQRRPHLQELEHCLIKNTVNFVTTRL